MRMNSPLVPFDRFHFAHAAANNQRSPVSPPGERIGKQNFWESEESSTLGYGDEAFSVEAAGKCLFSVFVRLTPLPSEPHK